MTEISLSDIDLLSVGNTIQLWGAIYAGEGNLFLIPLPDEDSGDLESHRARVLKMDASDLARFFNQTDVLDIKNEAKVILRKSQRQIDAAISWRVFERDKYKCCYCGFKGPLTVDHIDLWEEGGATIENNLMTCCRRCNKLRGNKPYNEWLESEDYQRVSREISPVDRGRNSLVGEYLGDLVKQRVKVRSR